jgi:hypothetical protein
MTVEVQYNNLNEIDGSIRLTIRGTANFIVARRIARIRFMFLMKL